MLIVRDIAGKNEDALRHRLNLQLKPSLCSIRIDELIGHMTGRTLLHAALQRFENRRGFDARPHLHIYPAEQFIIWAVIMFLGRSIQIEIAPVMPEDLTA